MCGTPSAGAFSLATSAIGGIGGAISSIFAAQSEKMGLAFASRMAEMNADEQRGNAREALRQGGEAETRHRLDTARLKSRQIAAMAANGVQLDNGSALNNLVSTDYLGEVDAATIRQNAVREAAGFRTSATNFSNEALMRRAASRSISPMLSGLTSLLGSAGKVASDWYAFKDKGVEVGFVKKSKTSSAFDKAFSGNWLGG